MRDMQRYRFNSSTRIQGLQPLNRQSDAQRARAGRTGRIAILPGAEDALQGCGARKQEGPTTQLGFLGVTSKNHLLQRAIATIVSLTVRKLRNTLMPGRPWGDGRNVVWP